jgi:hypothetical protein
MRNSHWWLPVAGWMDKTDIINHINMINEADLNGGIFVIYTVLRLISMLTRKNSWEHGKFPSYWGQGARTFLTLPFSELPTSC